jgi:hypothetical protein
MPNASAIVIHMPPSFPGVNSFATAPTINPISSFQSKANMFASSPSSPLTRTASFSRQITFLGPEIRSGGKKIKAGPENSFRAGLPSTSTSTSLACGNCGAEMRCRYFKGRETHRSLVSTFRAAAFHASAYGLCTRARRRPFSWGNTLLSATPSLRRPSTRAQTLVLFSTHRAR